MKNGSQWKWHFAGELARAALGDHPEERFAAAVEVKANDRRQVLTDGKFFYKVERSRGRGFAAEFRRGIALEKEGIPVVQHLAFGTSAAGGALITLAEPGAVDAGAYVRREPVPEEVFAERLAEFTGILCRSPFFHGDLHLGNLLWIEAEKSFKLVDVRAVRRLPEWLKACKLLRMYRLPLELRTFLPESTLLRLLELAGVRRPERVFRQILRREAAALSREWPRRSQQVLTGYPKFSRIEGDLLIRAQVCKEELAAAEACPGDVRYMLASVFLDIARIPHRRVLACRNDVIYLDPRRDGNTSGTAAPEMLEDYTARLAVLGFSAVDGDWELDPDGVYGTPRLKDLAAVAERM